MRMAERLPCFLAAKDTRSRSWRLAVEKPQATRSAAILDQLSAFAERSKWCARVNITVQSYACHGSSILASPKRWRRHVVTGAKRTPFATWFVSFARSDLMLWCHVGRVMPATDWETMSLMA